MSLPARAAGGALTAVLLALAVGCGSTAGQLPVGSTGREGTAPDGVAFAPPNETGLSTAETPAAITGGAVPVVGTPSGGGGADLGAGPAAPAGANRPGPAAGGASTADKPRAAASARGVTATTITIGFEYSEGSEEANRAAGFNGITTGDQRKQIELLIAEVNRTGGMAGRTVKPVYHVYSAASSDSTARQEQAACADFSQDNEVFAVIAFGTHTENYISCLGKAGVAFVSAPIFTVSDRVVLRRNPLYRELNTVDLDTQFALYGNPLGGTGYYDKGAKIGLLTIDYPSMQRAVAGSLKPALSRIGQRVEDQVTLTAPQSTSDTGAFSAAIGNAVVRFRQKGITHVLITDVNGLTTVLFINAASNQKYYPRYGFTTHNGGQAVGDLVQDKRSLQGAVQLGWAPALDLNAANETIKPPGRQRCLSFYAGKGIQPDSRNAEAVLEATCDTFFFAQAAANRAATLSPQGFVQAYAGTRSAVPSASTYAVDLTGQAVGGAALYRVQRWVPGCTCFTAEGDTRRLR